jgi:hypothetical protein
MEHRRLLSRLREFDSLALYVRSSVDVCPADGFLFELREGSSQRRARIVVDQLRHVVLVDDGAAPNAIDADRNHWLWSIDHLSPPHRRYADTDQVRTHDETDLVDISLQTSFSVPRRRRSVRRS